jgi:hypothetical protein
MMSVSGCARRAGQVLPARKSPYQKSIFLVSMAHSEHRRHRGYGLSPSLLNASSLCQASSFPSQAVPQDDGGPLSERGGTSTEMAAAAMLRNPLRTRCPLVDLYGKGA